MSARAVETSFALTLRFFVFILAFGIEVRVHAKTPSMVLPTMKAPVAEPEGCLEKTSGACSFQTTKSMKYVAHLGASVVVLDADTTVVRTSETALTLVTGQVWIRSSGELKVSTEFGSVSVDGTSEFWVSRDSDQMRISAIASSIELTPRESTQVLRLDPGEENWLGGVARSTGVATSGVPQPIVFDRHIERWARLYDGSRKQFSADVEAFRSRWSRGLASIADYHRQIAQSHIDLMNHEAEQKAKSKAQYENRSLELRTLFRRKLMD